MKIEIWSDFICPFCYIGERKLKEAINLLPFLTDVELVFKSFELDPNAHLYLGKSIHEGIAEKYNITVEQAKRSNESIKQHANEVGLNFDFEQMKPTNTLNAHRLNKLAGALGLESKMTNALFNAYFEKGQLISDSSTLIDLAKSVGISETDSVKVLSDPQLYLNDVRQDEIQAQKLGISSAPYFVINDTYAISGAQPVELFVKALTDAWANQSKNSHSSTKGLVCNEDGCSV